jgi:uncharacterized protein
MKAMYLHGLGSNGESSTAKTLQQAGVNIIAPSYAPQYFEGSIRDLVDALTINNIDQLIGTSMGGYYALKLSEMTGIPALVINACFEPYNHLQKYIGQSAIDYATNEPIPFFRETIEAFHPLYIERIISPVIFIGERDNVLLPEDQKAFCTAAGWRWISVNWGHRVEDPSLIIEQLALLAK